MLVLLSCLFSSSSSTLLSSSSSTLLSSISSFLLLSPFCLSTPPLSFHFSSSLLFLLLLLIPPPPLSLFPSSFSISPSFSPPPPPAKYDHRPEVLGNIKRETQGILNDALVQRGLSKVRMVYRPHVYTLHSSSESSA